MVLYPNFSLGRLFSAHSISLISFVVNLAKEACLGRYCRIRDHCIVRHSLRYYRHSGPVIYMSKLPASSISMPCDYRILQSPIKEQVKLVLYETVERSQVSE